MTYAHCRIWAVLCEDYYSSWTTAAIKESVAAFPKSFGCWARHYKGKKSDLLQGKKKVTCLMFDVRWSFSFSKTRKCFAYAKLIDFHIYFVGSYILYEFVWANTINIYRSPNCKHELGIKSHSNSIELINTSTFDSILYIKNRFTQLNRHIWIITYDVGASQAAIWSTFSIHRARARPF
jgi:hypothetical protein